MFESLKKQKKKTRCWKKLSASENKTRNLMFYPEKLLFGNSSADSNNLLSMRRVL